MRTISGLFRSPWINRETFSWALYDFADQAFSVLFVTLFVPILIKVHLGGTEFQVGLMIGLSLLVGALLVPLIGAISDATGRRIPFLIASAWLTALFAILTSYAGLFAALVLAALANVSHLIARDVYDAKMTDLVEERHYGALSGFGLFFGYIGAIVTLGVAYLLLQHFGWETIDGIRASFWQASLWFVVFSIPLIVCVPDVVRKTASIKETISDSFTELKATVISIPKRNILLRYLIASFFYGNAMNTIVVFLGLFGRDAIGLSVRDFFPAFALMALTSAVGAIFVGRLSDTFGPFTILRVILVGWLLVVGALFSLFLIDSYLLFLSLGAVGGLIFGAVWVLNRHVIASITPKEEVAKIFGIDGLTEKSAGIVGPIVFGFLVTFSGYPAALSSMLVFFVLGLLILPGDVSRKMSQKTYPWYTKL